MIFDVHLALLTRTLGCVSLEERGVSRGVSASLRNLPNATEHKAEPVHLQQNSTRSADRNSEDHNRDNHNVPSSSPAKLSVNCVASTVSSSHNCAVSPDAAALSESQAESACYSFGPRVPFRLQAMVFMSSEQLVERSHEIALYLQRGR